MSQPIDFYRQGTSFAQPPQQQQQTAPQPIRLANPTQYHLAQTQLRKNQKQISSNVAPPTPNNSFQTNNTLSNFSNTIDPQILINRQLYHSLPIKQESEISSEMDFDHTNVLSPMSNSSGGSPTTNHNFEELAGRSFRPASHLENIETFSSYGGSPGAMYSPGGVDNVDYSQSFVDDFSPMSAPTTTFAAPVDVKTNMSNNTKMTFRQPHTNIGQITSMSLPAQLLTNNAGNDWHYGSVDVNVSNFQQPSSYTNEIIPSSNYLEEDAADSQKAALMFEKRRRRRESHNAVERRRRDNINEKIQELSTLLPDLYVDSANKPNKGVILRKSVDYIRQLQSAVEAERNRNVKLESQIRELSSHPTDNNSGSASSRSDLNNSSGGPFGSSLP